MFWFSILLISAASSSKQSESPSSCIRLHRNRILKGAFPERVLYVESLSQCVGSCLTASPSGYCDRVTFQINGRCLLFEHKIPQIFAGDSERLVRRNGAVFASLKIDCLYRNFMKSNSRHRRSDEKRREPPAPPPVTPAGPPAPPPPAGASYTVWSEWSPCSASCGSGKRQRIRDCNQGYNCIDNTLVEYKNCNKGPCSQWGQWTEWNSCSVTCGKGARKRSRFCNTYYGCPGNREEVQDCEPGPCSQWRPWGPWGACSKICGGGERKRTRGCTTYGGCQGESSETKNCNQHSCCAKWGQWSQCSITCGPPGSGLETRTKRCTVEGNGPYGYASRLEEETRPCGDYLTPCGQWQTWEPWASCTVTCGGGERSRIRTCSVEGACKGKHQQYKRCHDEECPGFQPWGPWTLCTSTCNGGTKTRKRVCDVEGECEGAPTQEMRCNEQACPEWTEWGPWSRCTEECGGGWQRRGRVCNQYNLCPGDKKEKRICNEHECSEWATWTDWGDCSVPCAGGVKLRTRACNMDQQFCQGDTINDPSCFCEGKPEDGMACNKHDCAHWGSWSEWSQCNNECGGGEHVRTRKCENDADFCVGDNKNHPSCVCSEGTNSETQACNPHQCPQWSTWGEWGQCSEPCGGGAKERKRTCVVDETFCAKAQNNNTFSCACPGLDHSNDQCNAHECPYWGRWSKWNQCTAPCGGGVQVRTRICKVDDTACPQGSLGPSCQCQQGAPEQEQPCNEHTCAQWTEWTDWSQCSVTCGKGSIERTRECENDPDLCYGEALEQPSCQCEGVDGETQDCNAGECFTWASWQPWGVCSQVCGGGSRNRARECPEADACPGLGEETEFCNQLPCPDWGSWGAWSSCSVTCGGGQHVRNRACPLPNGCSPGEPFADEECNADKCPEWTNWMEWSECSRTCGEGERRRTRECVKDNEATTDGCLGRSEDLESCFDTPCELSTFWSAWSPCTQTCGGGVKTRQRATCVGKPDCETETEQQPCEQGACPQWSTWAQWTSCSKSCGSGSRTRERQCVDGSGNEIPRGCVGKTTETDPNACNAIAC